MASYYLGVEIQEKIKGCSKALKRESEKRSLVDCVRIIHIGINVKILYLLFC